MTVVRNISDFPLMPGINKNQRLEVMKKMEECCKEFEDDLEGTFYKLEDISESDKKLIADIMVKKPDDKTFESYANQGKDWPSGRAIFSNDDKNFYIHVNNEDHMKITFI